MLEARERPILFSASMVRAILAGTKTQTRRVLSPQPELAIMDAVLAGALQAAADVGLVPSDEKPRWRWRGTFMMPWPSCVRHLSPYGRPGDRLWVREAWAPIWPTEFAPEDIRDCQVQYRADWPNDKYPGHWPDDCGDDDACGRWKPSIHMPRWASRITLDVTSVRVERLQDITAEDATAEGAVFTDWGKHEHTLSVDGGKTWGNTYSQRSGWHFGDAPSHEHCLGSARMAFANLWNRLNAKTDWDSNPWVWVVGLRPATAHGATQAEETPSQTLQNKR